MTKKQTKKVVKDRSNINYILHRIIRILERMNRDGKVDDSELRLLHTDIDMIIK